MTSTSMSTFVVVYLIHHAVSRSITIRNAGFEEDITLDPNTFAYGDGIIAFWETYDNFNLLEMWDIGVTNPSNSTLFTNFSANAPEGDQIAYVDQPNAHQMTKEAFGISQTLTERLSIDTVYNLKVWVGNPDGNTYNEYREYYYYNDSTSSRHIWPSNEEFYYESKGLPGYKIDLLAGDDIIAQDYNTQNIIDGQWIESNLEVGPFSPEHTNIGELLTIRLMNLNEGEGPEVVFDDVRLDAVPTTSPTSSPTISPENDQNYDDHISALVTAVICISIAFVVLLSLAMCVCCYLFYRKYSKKHENTNEGTLDRKASTELEECIPSNMPKDLEQWLTDMNLEEHHGSFVENGFDKEMSALAELNDSDLLQIGVTLMADRKIILREIKKLSHCDIVTAGNNAGTDEIPKVGPMLGEHLPSKSAIDLEGGSDNQDDANSVHGEEGNETALDAVIDVPVSAIEKKQSDDNMY